MPGDPRKKSGGIGYCYTVYQSISVPHENEGMHQPVDLEILTREHTHSLLPCLGTRLICSYSVTHNGHTLSSWADLCMCETILTVSRSHLQSNYYTVKTDCYIVCVTMTYLSPLFMNKVRAL